MKRTAYIQVAWAAGQEARKEAVALGTAEGGNTQGHVATAGGVHAALAGASDSKGAASRWSAGLDDARAGGAGGAASADAVVVGHDLVAAEVVEGAGASAQVVVRAGAPAQMVVQGRTSSVQV